VELLGILCVVVSCRLLGNLVDDRHRCVLNEPVQSQA